MGSPLTVKDAARLREIASQQSATLAQITEQFRNTFTGPQRFRACIAIIIQLTSPPLLTSPSINNCHLINLLFLLAEFRYSSNKSFLSSNPFTAFFLSLLDSLDDSIRSRSQTPRSAVDHRLIERQFIIRVIFDDLHPNIRHQSSAAIIETFRTDKFCFESANPQTKSELSRLLEPVRTNVNKNTPPSTPTLSLTSSSIPPPRTPVSQTISSAFSTSPSTSDSATTRTPQSAETKSPISASSSLTSNSSSLSYESLLEMLQKAQKSSLNSADRASITAALTNNEPLCLALIEHGLNPSQWSMIVEKNPSIASPFIESLLTSDHRAGNLPRSAPFLAALSKIELSLHSMEVVNRLTSAAASPQPPFNLPSDFLPSYIIHAIDRCKSLKDKYLQTRLVRLVCVFLQSLLRLERHAPIDKEAGLALKDLFQEISAFCAEFSKVKESASLFAAIKEAEQLNNNQNQHQSSVRQHETINSAALAT